MRRLVFAFLLSMLWCLPSLPLGAASFAPLEQQLERQIKQKAPAKATPVPRKTTPPATKPPTGIMALNAQITQALNRVILRADDPHIWDHMMPWKTFLKQ